MENWCAELSPAATSLWWACSWCACMPAGYTSGMKPFLGVMSTASSMAHYSRLAAPCPFEELGEVKARDPLEHLHHAITHQQSCSNAKQLTLLPPEQSFAAASCVPTKIQHIHSTAVLYLGFQSRSIFKVLVGAYSRQRLCGWGQCADCLSPRDYIPQEMVSGWPKQVVASIIQTGLVTPTYRTST